jgi:hypothetical protein
VISGIVAFFIVGSIGKAALAQSPKPVAPQTESAPPQIMPKPAPVTVTTQPIPVRLEEVTGPHYHCYNCGNMFPAVRPLVAGLINPLYYPSYEKCTRCDGTASLEY